MPLYWAVSRSVAGEKIESSLPARSSSIDRLWNRPRVPRVTSPPRNWISVVEHAPSELFAPGCQAYCVLPAKGSGPPASSLFARPQRNPQWNFRTIRFDAPGQSPPSLCYPFLLFFSFLSPRSYSSSSLLFFALFVFNFTAIWLWVLNKNVVRKPDTLFGRIN